jgi:E3 ubiquitin-protein ligase DOA10
MAAVDSLNPSQGLERAPHGVATPSPVDGEISDNDEHEMVCRICRMPGDEEPLYHPCKCSGSIRYVHSSCLSKWLEHSKHDSCEVMLA